LEKGKGENSSNKPEFLRNSGITNCDFCTTLRNPLEVLAFIFKTIRRKLELWLWLSPYEEREFVSEKEGHQSPK